MMGLVRDGKGKVRGPGFSVTWDVDSRDQATVNRLRYFIFGRKARGSDEGGERRGFVWKSGVRYVAQSIIFVLPHRLPEIETFLRQNGIDYDVDTVVYV